MTAGTYCLTGRGRWVVPGSATAARDPLSGCDQLSLQPRCELLLDPDELFLSPEAAGAGTYVL